MEKIFSTKERIKILKAVIFSEQPIRVNVVAARLKISKGLVSKYFDVLLREGIAKKSNGKYLIVDSAVTKGTKILLNVADIDTGIFKKLDFVEAVGLYGSCAKGENTDESDVDLWIKVKDESDEKAASLSAQMNKKIKNVKPLFLTTKKIEKIKKGDELFYHSLAFGSIILYGAKDAIQL
ncbi:nucleotidyltransferase domain-containing protein [Candidatus Gottesmanbacteria bacterium]|nr:nucleotidyltransferase domain-containing protein [Candidatus Gottesmanbacteria bacterium]